MIEISMQIEIDPDEADAAEVFVNGVIDKLEWTFYITELSILSLMKKK